MRKLKTIYPSTWVLNMDTDEFLTYNYVGDDEDATTFLSNSTVYQRMVKGLRKNRLKVRKRLPMPLTRKTIDDFLATAPVKACIKIPGLQMSARESNLSDVLEGVPSSVDARTLMTLRHTHHGNKLGRFTKCLINLAKVPRKAINQEYTRTIHNPLANICGKHASLFIGTDYISSVLRLHHYAGTRESFEQRRNDARQHGNASYNKRNVEPLGENTDVRPWIQAFVNQVGQEEAERLLQPLKEAYAQTDWSAVWNENGAPIVEVATVKERVPNTLLAVMGVENESES